MRWKRLNTVVRRFATVAALAIPLTGCTTTTSTGDAGCASYAEARLTRPPTETVAAIPTGWADWIADLDDRMTGTCR